MNLQHLLTLIPALLGLSGADLSQVDQHGGHSVTIEQATVFRIPVRPHPPLVPMIEWGEHKGPKCLAAAEIAGAVLAGPAAIDFVMRDRQRLRARVDEDCTALDFYDGFYVQPEDDRLCAGRDEIRSRMGGSCRIERFRTLVPTLKR